MKPRKTAKKWPQTERMLEFTVIDDGQLSDEAIDAIVDVLLDAWDAFEPTTPPQTGPTDVALQVIQEPTQTEAEQVKKQVFDLVPLTAEKM